MAEAQAGKLGFFDKIRQEEDAVKITHAASLVFLGVGLFFAILSYWATPELWIHGLAYIVLGLILRQFRSRVIASLLVLLAVTTALLQVRLLPSHAYSAGISIIVAAIAVFVGIRALEAAIRFRQKRGAKAPAGNA